MIWLSVIDLHPAQCREPIGCHTGPTRSRPTYSFANSPTHEELTQHIHILNVDPEQTTAPDVLQ